MTKKNRRKGRILRPLSLAEIHKSSIKAALSRSNITVTDAIYASPSMDMLFFYRKFFVNLYSQAGLDRAHEQITRVINLYEVKLFLEGEIEKNKRRASRSSKFITLERAVGVDDPAKRNRRQIKNLHIQRGRDRSTCRLYEDKLTQLPDFDAWLATLPAVVFLQNDLPLEHEVPPPKQLRGRRLLIGGI